MLEFLDTWLFHWSDEKAIWLGTHTLSWDARCAGIHVGIGIAVLYHLALGRNAKHLPSRRVLVAAAALFLPLLIDVATLFLGLRAPSNEWRFATGLAFGAGLVAFLYPAVIALAVPRGEARAVLDGRGFFGLAGALCAALLVKALGGAAAYYVLETVGILGMCSLFIMIALGAFSALRSFQGKSGGKWGQQQDSVGERQAR